MGVFELLARDADGAGPVAAAAGGDVPRSEATRKKRREISGGAGGAVHRARGGTAGHGTGKQGGVGAFERGRGGGGNLPRAEWRRIVRARRESEIVYQR